MEKRFSWKITKMSIMTVIPLDGQMDVRAKISFLQIELKICRIRKPLEFHSGKFSRQL